MKMKVGVWNQVLNWNVQRGTGNLVIYRVMMQRTHIQRVRITVNVNFHLFTKILLTNIVLKPTV